MAKPKHIHVVELPTYEHLTQIAGDDGHNVAPDVLLDTKQLIEVPKDRLTIQEIRYMRKRVRKLIKNLRSQYELLGRATGDTREVTAQINLLERTVRLEFTRVAGNQYLTEAVVDADIGLIRPRTQKELKALGIEAPRDPDEPERHTTLTGLVYRPQANIATAEWHELPLESFRIVKIPSSGIQLFNRMVAEGFLYHPRSGNYIPFKDSPTPLEPLGRRDRRAQEKRPLEVLEITQRDFVHAEFRKFERNFKNRFGYIFENVEFEADGVDQTYMMHFRVSDAFAGEGSPQFTIQGEFDLTWRNKGKAGTALELRITGGLSKRFQQAVNLTAPINIAGFRVETDKEGHRREKHNGQRKIATEMLFNLLAMSGKIGVEDADAAEKAQKAYRRAKPTAEQRRFHHRRQRGEDRRIEHAGRYGLPPRRFSR